MTINIWFDHEEQLKIKEKVEKFLGEEVPNFLGSPHMHLFYKIIQKLEANPSIIPNDIHDAEKALDDAKAQDFFKVVTQDVPTIEKDVKEVTPDGNQSAANANDATSNAEPADAPTPTGGTEPTPK